MELPGRREGGRDIMREDMEVVGVTREDVEDKGKWRDRGSMIYAPTTNAPAQNANVAAYIHPDPNPNPNPNPYPALNQKHNHTPESNSVIGAVSMPEQLSPEHMSCHRDRIPCVTPNRISSRNIFLPVRSR